MATGRETSGTLRTFLRRDHARIEGLQARLLDDLGDGAGSPGDLWVRFEAGLLDHMAAEERHLLRRFGQAFGREAARLRAQHAEFRRALAEMRAAPELRRRGLEGLVRDLCEHARFEDRLLYRWAERELDVALQERITRELSQKDRATALGHRG